MSPYPSGQIAPAHFVPLIGGGFEEGLIRIEAVASAPYNSVIDGQGAQDIPQPPNIGEDDDLFVIIASSGTLSQPSNSGDWTQVIAGFSNHVKVFRRKATGGTAAADQFGIAVHTNRIIAFMCRIRHTTDFINTPVIFQGGFLNTPNNGNDWDVGFPPGTSLVFTAINDPDAFVMLVEFKQANTNLALSPSIIQNEPDGMELIAAITLNELDASPAIDTIWINWMFKYTNPSIAYAEFTQSYAPFPTNGSHYTQHTRWTY